MSSYTQTHRTAGTSHAFYVSKTVFFFVTTTSVIATVGERSWYLVAGLHIRPDASLKKKILLAIRRKNP